MYMCVMRRYGHVSVSAHEARSIGFSGARVIGHYELPDLGAGIGLQFYKSP